MSRDAILNRIRAATAGEHLQRPSPMQTPPSLASRGPDTVRRFSAAATAKGVTVIDVASPLSLPKAIAQALSATHVSQRSLRLNDEAYVDLPWSEAGLTMARGPADRNDAIALSRAIAAVAETGTLMLSSSAANPTTLAFVPETHLVILDRTSVLGTFEDATALLRQNYGNAMPRTVNFISGASRTGDIGGRIVHGAHGPRHLMAFLI